MAKTESLVKLTQRQLEALTEKELKQIVSTLRSTAAKRVTRLESAEQYTPAYTNLMQGRGLPNVRGMSHAELLNYYKSLSTFISAKTSTLKGAKKYRERQAMVQKEVISDLIPDDPTLQGRMWALFDKMVARGWVTPQNYRLAMQYVVKDLDQNLSDRTVLNKKRFKRQMEKLYEEQIQTEAHTIYTSPKFGDYTADTD